MTSVEFCYWLQGFFELDACGSKTLTVGQRQMIERHLALVFQHDIDPKQGDAEMQAVLQTIHDGPQKTATGQVLFRC